MLLLLSIPVSLAGRDEDRIRVMTYNIRYAGDETREGTNSWTNRKQPVASMIRFHRPDILGVQEALKIQLDDLIELLPGYAWIGVGRDDGAAAGEFSAIVFCKERFEILETSTFWLSEMPQQPSKGWDAAYPRVVTWAKIRDRRTGKTAYFFNTHFDHQGERARIGSARLVKDTVVSIAGGSPIILTGDFNFRPESKGYQILTEGEEKGFTDAQRIARYGHYGSNITFNDFGRSLVEGNKIDYIFVKNAVEVFQHGVISETFQGRYPSDHMPVVADVGIR